MARDGDIRVLMAMNLVLSTLFGTGIVWGLSFIGVTEFTMGNVATAVAVLVAITYIVALRP